MTQSNVGWVIALSLLISSQAGAQNAVNSVVRNYDGTKVYFDDNLMPRCLVKPGEQTGTLLRWRGDVYIKDIEAVPLSSFPGHGRDNDGRLRRLPHAVCKNWRSLDEFSYLGRGTPADPRSSHYPSRVQSALTQVALGGTVYHADPTAAAWLAHHRGFEFDLAANRNLTAQYGAGFVAQIYKAFIEANPRNLAFKTRLQAHISLLKQIDPSEEKAALSSRAQGITVLNVPGLGQKPHEETGREIFKLHDLYGDFASMGVDLVQVEQKPATVMVNNIAASRQALDALLTEGKNVIIMGGSMGAPEMLEAVADLKDKLEGPNRPDGYGKVVGIINLSGVLHGSYVADRIEEKRATGELNGLITMFPGSSLSQTTHDMLDSIRDLTTANSEPRYRHYVDLLPKDAVIVTLVGTVPGNGLVSSANGLDALAAPKAMVELMTLFNNGRPYDRTNGAPAYFGRLITRMKAGTGANDSYVEYPENEFRAGAHPHSYTVALDSSHYLMDGRFDGNVMFKAEDRRRVLTALMETVLDYAFARN